MAMTNSFPPDVPKDTDDMREEAGATVRDLRGKAADMAGKAGEAVKERYEQAREAWDEAEPLETVREGGEMVARTVERHPLATLGLGVLSVGLIAWATLRSQPSSRWESYQPDTGWLRGWLDDRGSDVAEAGHRAYKSGSKWLRSRGDEADDYMDRASGYAARARNYADMGGRMLVKRAEREPMAALVGVGLAVYVIGSLLSSAYAGERPAPTPTRKRTARR